MSSSYLDENGIPTITGALDTDGSTITRILANSSNHLLRVSNGTSGTNHPRKNDLIDSNGRRSLMAVSSSDGFTPIVLYVNSSGSLLIQST